MIDTREFEEALGSFTDKYYVVFEYQQFETQRRKFELMGFDKPGDMAYAIVFSDLYKKAVRGLASGELKDLNSDRMLEDFEKMLMAPYRKSCNAQNERHDSTPYAGKTRLEWLNSMQAYAAEAPKSCVDFFAEKYLSRNVRLRDIRAFAHSSQYEGTIEQKRVGMTYIAALEKVHSGRSALWKVFHPIQNYCEKRDIKDLKETLDYDSNKNCVDGENRVVLEDEISHLNKLIRSERSGYSDPVERIISDPDRDQVEFDEDDLDDLDSSRSFSTDNIIADDKHVALDKGGRQI